MTVRAYAVTQAKGDFEPFEFDPVVLAGTSVDIAVGSCGICHSDLSMVDDEWGMAQFPLVPGHEVIGKVSAVGEQVSHLSVGSSPVGPPVVIRHMRID